MVEGFWIALFDGMQGRGGGVLVLNNGIVFGGNSGHTWTGTYEIAQDMLHAQVKVQRFLAGVGNAWGVHGDFELHIKATVQGDIIKGMAALHPEGTALPIKLSRRGTLP
jgi:hypothetical protein